MGRPGVGNPGNKGGGRKSAYEEMKAAEMVVNAFINGLEMEDIERISRLMAGQGEKGEKLKLMEVALVKALKSDKIMSTLLDKMLPSKIDQTTRDDTEYELDDDKRAALKNLVKVMRNGK